jgi:hypothetical protein
LGWQSVKYTKSQLASNISYWRSINTLQAEYKQNWGSETNNMALMLTNIQVWQSVLAQMAILPLQLTEP